MPSLIAKLVDVPHVFIDFETTGASAAYGDRAIELGMVRVEGAQRVAEYQQLFDPGRRVSAGITALTGISTDMVAGQPRFSDQVETILNFMRGAIVLGHNVRFDLSFMQNEMRRAGRSLGDDLGPGVVVMDTVRIARRMFGRGGNGLQRLSRRLGITPVVAHRALADAQTTHFVFEKLLERVGGWNLMLCDALAHQGGIMGLLPTRAAENPLPLELEEALEFKRPVLMEYLDARDRRTQRVIKPLQIRRFRGETLLVAHCEMRNDRRTFRLDRIVELKRIEPGTVSPANVCDMPFDLSLEAAPIATVLSQDPNNSADVESDEANSFFANKTKAPLNSVGLADVASTLSANVVKPDGADVAAESTIDDAVTDALPTDVAVPEKEAGDVAGVDGPVIPTE